MLEIVSGWALLWQRVKIVIRGLDPAYPSIFTNAFLQMGCRVKPGNDKA
jgi:hypothetical protein